MIEKLFNNLKAFRKHFTSCNFFGHKWKYNFPIYNMPNKAICSKCFAKSKLNLRTLEWEDTPDFGGDKRTNEELVKQWN